MVKMVFLKHVVFVSLAFASCLIFAVEGLAGGRNGDPCDYPGVAAVVVDATDVLTCHGVIEGETLYLPELCSTILLFQSVNSNITVHYGDGNSVYNIPARGLRGSMNGGTYRVDVSGIPNTGACETGATLFVENAHTLADPNSCDVVGYGPSSNTAVSFEGDFNVASVTKSTTAGCCEHIIETYTEAEKGPLSDTKPKNCLRSDGATCSVAELGAPIYCDTTTGDKVVIGLASAVPCVPGGVFTAHDLTGSSDQVKFGI